MILIELGTKVEFSCCVGCSVVSGNEASEGTVDVLDVAGVQELVELGLLVEFVGLVVVVVVTAALVVVVAGALVVVVVVVTAIVVVVVVVTLAVVVVVVGTLMTAAIGL